eukprot:61746_1
MAVKESASVSRYFSDLRKRDPRLQLQAAKGIRAFIESGSRSMPAENFTRFMNEVFNQIFDIVNTGDSGEILGGIMLIDELIDVQYCQYDETNVIKFASYLRWVLKPTHSDVAILELVASTLGHLVRSGGSLTSDIVESEVKRALEWLEGSSHEYKKHAAVLVLKELAENAPTLFNVHVGNFLDHIWVALRDPKNIIREGAVAAIRACLKLIAKRDTRQRVKWYFQVYNEAGKGFKIGTPESIHGSLLTIGELLQNSGEFMLARFKEVCERVLQYRDHRDRMVCRTVIALLPRLVVFCPDAFVRGYLSTCLDHLINTLKNHRYRETAYTALGEIAVTVGDHIVPYLSRIVPLIRDGLQGRGVRRPFSNSALLCMSMLAQAVGVKLLPHLGNAIDQMFSNGLSPTLIKSLTGITEHIPALLPEVQDRLAVTVSKILRSNLKVPGTHINRYSLRDSISRESDEKSTTFSPRLSHASGSKKALASLQPPDSAQSDSELISLALRTLGTFDVQGQDLLPFVRGTVSGFLDYRDPEIRKEATMTCAKLLRSVCRYQKPNRMQKSIIAQVLERLLCAGIADPAAEIRETVLASLDTEFDHYLSQADNLGHLFIALNDEVFPIRVQAMGVIGRLAQRNPAYVLPALRKTLVQLLTDLQFSKEPKSREESSQLLGQLIQSARSLIHPYIGPILKVLLPKLQDTDAAVASCVLETVGLLALVARAAMRKYLDQLLPLIIETLRDKSSLIKREVALQALGRLVESTGSVIVPYVHYKDLLPTLLAALSSDHSRQVRKEAMRTLGILGALDPFQHKMHQRDLLDKPASGTIALRPVIGLHPSSVFHSSSASLSTCSEEYYPTVSINALMKILKEPAQSTYHNMVIQAVMFIFKNLGLKCVPFLPQIIPPFLQVLAGKSDSSQRALGKQLDHSDDTVRETLFHQLAVLVSIVKVHIRNYLDDIFKLVHQYWGTSDHKLFCRILSLVEQISIALKDEFKVYIPGLIPQLLDVLHNNRTAGRESALNVLHTLETFGSNLDDHLFLVIPPLTKLAEQVDGPLKVPTAAMQTIGQLCRVLDFSSYSLRIIHPLVRILDSPVPELRPVAMHTLCCLLFQLGKDYAIFIPVVEKAIKKHGIEYADYSRLVDKLLRDQAFDHTDFSFVPDGKVVDEKFDDVMSTTSVGSAVKKLQVNQPNLRKAWDSAQRATREDWTDWMRCFSIELLKESPSPALRSCSALAQKHSALARELFNPAFISCWGELLDQYQDDLVRSLEQALNSHNIPPDVLHTLLSLAEFMEHDDKPLPIDIRTLGALAESSHSFAKALHYKEIEFFTSPYTTIEALISINNHLQQPEAAMGILEYAQQQLSSELKEVKDVRLEAWYEKLQRWEDALCTYERKQLDDPTSVPLTLGRMRCLRALGEFERLSYLAADLWQRADEASVHRQIAPLAASAAWQLSRWDDMDRYVQKMTDDDAFFREGTTPTGGVDIHARSVAEGSFFKAILAVHRNNMEEAQKHIVNTRELLDAELTALVGESYSRAYRLIVKVQQLSELEEVIHFKQVTGTPTQTSEHARLREMWSARLGGCQQDVEVWAQLLAVRALVIRPQDDIPTWLKFSALCRKSGRLSLALEVILSLWGLKEPPAPDQDLPSEYPAVSFAFMKHIWSAGFQEEALVRLRGLVETLGDTDLVLQSGCFLKLGQWQMRLGDELNDENIGPILYSFERATKCDPGSYKAWHQWALMNYHVVVHFETLGNARSAQNHLVPAVQGFFRSVGLESGLGPERRLQDVLRLLNLWFKHGAKREVEQALVAGFNTISIDTWLVVIPQIIARIHTGQPQVRRLIHELLSKIGRAHPQALIYPLTVASKSQTIPRRSAAMSLLDAMRYHSEVLVDQALLVSQELIRVSILWHEMWHEALEEASKLFFGARDVPGMLNVLRPVQKMMEKGPETIREVAFQQAFGRDLQEASEWLKKYQRSRQDSDLDAAWELFCAVFRRINKQLPQLTELELQYVSPKLLDAKDLELAVPGTYQAGQPLVSISHFAPSLRVLDSKQRPRKLSIKGSDGQPYEFLLKGHEDLRQDERVMQLFGLLNTLLEYDRDTSKRDLRIKRYSVIPLAPNSGLIEWIPYCDTFHQLVKEYRESRNILLNVEHRLIFQMSSDYQNLTLLQKIEIFERTLQQTTGQDLYHMLWLKSETSEVWLDRRTNFTRSLAVMSMVGYILGLGDRHPCNLMVDRHSGKLIHIDFGDCFEVAMHREKFPEKIPFRLTRMLINAMEVSGIEGNFRTTCESVMRVMHENKESLMAVLEAFVYDPLINWRLLKTDDDEPPRHGSARNSVAVSEVSVAAAPLQISEEMQINLKAMSRRSSAAIIGRSASSHALAAEQKENQSDVLNERAIQVIERVSNKLTGRDFANEVLEVPAQVERLIQQATSHENLCQCYMGWCPTW